MDSVNPTTGVLIRSYAEDTDAEVAGKLRLARAAFGLWRERSVAVRAEVLRQTAKLLRDEKRRLATLATQEMGKTLTSAEAEVEKCATVCDYYAEQAPEFLRPQDAPSDAQRSYVRFDPLGPVLAVMPWNFPYWQVFRFAAPALAAGNVGLLKHASNVTGCALAIEDVFRRAGADEGVFSVLAIGAGRVASVIEDSAVAAVTLTGSDAAGRSVARAAGGALKKVVLELGGSDPFIVLPDAELERAVEIAVQSRILNAGQSCIAAKRFIVHNEIRARFEDALLARMGTLRLGDPMNAATDLGPLARADLVEELNGQVSRSIAAGARLALGGQLPRGPGYFYPPTVLLGVKPGMAVFDEETFGPVAAVIGAADAQDAIRLANHSPLGLGAALFTQDLQRAERLAGQLDVGAVFVNGLVKSDPRLPFGGVKASGFGRELGQYGFNEFLNLKTIWIR